MIHGACRCGSKFHNNARVFRVTSQLQMPTNGHTHRHKTGMVRVDDSSEADRTHLYLLATRYLPLNNAKQ
jgi:hypothetical protein